MNSKELQDIRRELLVLNADFDDLVKKVDKLAAKLHTFYDETEDKLNGILKGTEDGK